MNIRLLTDADAADFQALRLRGLAEAPQAFASSVEEEGSHRILAEKPSCPGSTNAT